jgi:hypothetical protein
MNTTTKKSNITPSFDYKKYYSGRQTIGALFVNRSDAENAINALKARGFRGEQIGIALRDRDAQGQLIEDTGTKAAEGAATGAIGGGLLGGLVGFLIGVGALAIPGIGPVISAGVLATTFGAAGATALAGAGIGAATGGIVGGLVGMGVPETEAQYFETGFRKGQVLVTVNPEGRIDDVVQVLREYGGDTGVSTAEMASATPNTVR